MVVNFDFDAFFDELKATKPPYKCPFKDCEKVYKTYTGIQYHVVTLHKPANKTEKWHHRQMRCPITPPKSVSSAEAASEGEGEVIGDVEGRLEVEFEETKYIFNDADNLDIEISLSKQRDPNSETNKDGHIDSRQLHCNMDEAEQILKEEPKKPLPLAVFHNILRPSREVGEFLLPNDKYIITNKNSESTDDKMKYLIDEEDKSWLAKFEPVSVIDEVKFELAMEVLEKESAFVTRCENRNPNNNSTTSIEDEDGTTQDENAVCSICGDGSCHASNAILFCDMCDMAVHQECYGVPYVPEGQWLCRRCLHSPSKTAQCCLCPCPGGALKQTSDGRWAHVLCSAWVPEINFANPVFLEPIEGMENIPSARWRLVCFLCRRRKVGACIQCHQPNCYTAFHVTCALFAGLHLEMTQRGTDNGLKGIFIPGHSTGNVRKTAYCDLHAQKPGSRNNKSLKKDDADPASDGNESDACEQMDENRKLLAGDDEGDDDYDPGSLSKSKMDVVTKSRSAMTRMVASKMKHIVGVVSYPMVSQEVLDRVSEILEMNSEDDFLQRLKSYWMLKRLSRNGVPLIRGLQPNIVPKEDNEREKDDEMEGYKDGENDNMPSVSEDKTFTKRPGRRPKKRVIESDDEDDGDDDDDDDDTMLSMTCGDDERDVDEGVNQDETLSPGEETINDVTDIKEEIVKASSPHPEDDENDEDGDEWNARDMTGGRKRKLAHQDVPSKRAKLGRRAEDQPKKSTYSKRLKFYGDSKKEVAAEENEMEESNDDNIKRSKRARKMSSALFDYTYFGSVKKRRSNTKSEEEKSTKADQSHSSFTDDSFGKETTQESPKKTLNIKIDQFKLKQAKDLMSNKSNHVAQPSLPDSTTVEEGPARRGRRKTIQQEKANDTLIDEVNETGEPESKLNGAKHLREDLSKVKKILELVTQREECKLEEVRVKTEMYSLKLDPLTSILIRALDFLQEKDNHRFFAEPVDTEEVYDYLEVISRPMDFGTIRRKIERHEYSGVEQFEEDVNLIVMNCMKYNATGTIYYNAAVRLRNQGKPIINEAKKAEEQLKLLKKPNSTSVNGGAGADDDPSRVGAKSGSELTRKGRANEAASNNNKEDHLASVMLRIESVERKLDSSSGFLRETYTRQLKHLNRQMAALRGRKGARNSESTNGDLGVSEMPSLVNEDDGQNSKISTKPGPPTRNGTTQSQAVPSPSSSSFSNSAPSLSPQDMGNSSPLPHISSFTPPLLSSLMPSSYSGGNLDAPPPPVQMVAMATSIDEASKAEIVQLEADGSVNNCTDDESKPMEDGHHHHNYKDVPDPEIPSEVSETNGEHEE